MLKHNYYDVLNSRVLLYFILFLSIVDIFIFSIAKEYVSIVIFILVGILTSFFSKNMMVILTMALVGTNILRFGQEIRVEGMSESMDEEIEEDPADKLDAELKTENFEDEEVEEESKIQEQKQEKKPKSSTKSVKPTKTTDDNEKSIENLESLDEQTKHLLHNQKTLLEKMENLNPILENAETFMKQFHSLHSPAEKAKG